MIDPAASKRMEEALGTSVPFEALMSLAQDLKSEGMSKEEMYELFDHYRAVHDGDIEETLDDAILDVMDFIVGFCSPGRALFPNPPGSGEITEQSLIDDFMRN